MGAIISRKLEVVRPVIFCKFHNWSARVYVMRNNYKRSEVLEGIFEKSIIHNRENARQLFF